jgi:hypothetical protein
MLLLELAATMTGSHINPRDDFGLLRKTFTKESNAGGG